MEPERVTGRPVGPLDVVLRPGPGIPAGLVVPQAELAEQFSRSSGPGGQSVNTTDSRVELVFDATLSTVLDDERRARVLRSVPGGVFRVVASEHRSQHRNRAAARERLADQLRAALAPPPPSRKPTRPTRRSQRRRLEAKRQRGQTKALRGRVTE